MAHMQIAIGVRRAVVEDEALAPLADVAELFVELVLRPARKDGRLLLREAGLHREVRLRQEDGVSVIGCFGHWRRT